MITPAVVFWRVLAFLLARYELILAPNGVPYLSRWHFPTWLARRMGACQLFLHHFHTGDPDRGWHNHPWAWCESRLLGGAYVQECLWIFSGGVQIESVRSFDVTYRVTTEVFEAGDRNRLTSQFHAVRLLTPTVWTLFATGPKHGRSWGFKDMTGHFTPANPARGEMH